MKITLEIKSIKSKDGLVYLTLTHKYSKNYPSMIFKEEDFTQIQNKLIWGEKNEV
jgi:hypothetical protein